MKRSFRFGNFEARLYPIRGISTATKLKICDTCVLTYLPYECDYISDYIMRLYIRSIYGNYGIFASLTFQEDFEY